MKQQTELEQVCKANADTGNKGHFVRVPPALQAELEKHAIARTVSIPSLLVEAALTHYGIEAPLPQPGVRTRTAPSTSARAVAERIAKVAKSDKAPKDCGRSHPQPYCCCQACAASKKKGK